MFVAKPNSDASKKERSRTIRWVVTVFFVTLVVSGIISLISDEVMASSGLLAAFAILLGIVFLGIIFDIIGMAVATASEKPFHSMAAHKEKGAREALMLLRNASQVSSVCNDVVGDICGIVSGTTAAVIVVRLQTALDLRSVLISVAVTALISGLTIGGKALGKTFAMKQSTKVVYCAGRVLHVFHR